MRADRLVSLVLLLRQRGKLTADDLAAELEVSVRTVLRDIEALSTAGVPVYAERGRHGGFALLPGFRTELTGLNHDEALALLTAGAGRGEVFGLSSALSSAMRKVVDALPGDHQTSAAAAASRFLVEPGTDLLSRRREVDPVDAAVLRVVRRAVLAGHRLRIHYAATGSEPQWRTVDPVGLVTVRERGYLLALRDGADRTYRMSRILAAEELAEAAVRPDAVDLDQLWRERTAAFLSTDHIAVVVRVRARRRSDLLDTVRAVRSEEADGEDWWRVEVMFEDLRHATWALWQLGADAEALNPPALREALHTRARTLVERYGSKG
ncbi:helix-turn-helix transcriptional regulator [Propionibacteriaceae bacterium Y1685]|uniref:helix-turn-helix transcriptional regulator n=1 Tax=Microlunatus sp. Y1700 TaxID=3418487 RepID=UPI003B7A2557